MNTLRRTVEACLVVLILSISPITVHSQACVTNSQVTLTGNLRGANGIPSSNYTMTLAPSQQGYIAGCGVNLATQVACGTSTDGSVVGIPNPLTPTINTVSGGGSLPSGVYYSVYEFYDAAGHVTLVSPETAITLSVTSSLVVNPPTSGIPSNAVGMDVFIGTSSGGETLQGQTTGAASYVQASALVSGSAPTSTNNTLCQVTANDAVWPTGTGYQVSLTDSSGNPVPGYPMQWQLIGPGTTINLSNGLPYYHGVVYYPVPILSAPANHGQQSISGPLSFGGYNVTQVGKLGVGTGTPGWGVDNENSGSAGAINAKTGFLVNGGAGTVGKGLCSDGTYLDSFCAFITSLPTFYYQFVAGNGVTLPQEPKLNLIGGTNASVGCVDNVGSTRTDCTINNTSSGVVPNPNTPTLTFPASVATLDPHANDGAGEITTLVASSGNELFQINFGGTYETPLFCTVGGSTSVSAYSLFIQKPTIAITAWAISSNVVTFTAANTLHAGQVVALSGFGTSTFFNSTSVTVTTANSTTFVGAYTHANGSATENGVGTVDFTYGLQVDLLGAAFSGGQAFYLCHQ